ncbi:hypothetical protein AB1Y20_004365 [Prymnesium parvum]|uniref:ATP-dependent DNA helicase n=1 Tax=Prymnesium parvum TaxID=97485 RepID=A0AB34IZ08_PRYPA
MGNETSRLRDDSNEDSATTIHSEYMRYNRDPQMYIGKLLKRGVEWFILDEVGMMPSGFYDFLCHLRRAIHGLCIVLVGDYMQLTPVKDEWFVNFDKSCYFKTAAFADITGGNIIRFHKYMRGDRDDPQGGRVVFDTYMRFNRFIKGVVLIPEDAVTSAVKSAKSARDMDGALRLINAPIETLKQQIRGMRMNDILHAVVQMVDEHGTHETFPCNGLTRALRTLKQSRCTHPALGLSHTCEPTTSPMITSGKIRCPYVSCLGDAVAGV